MSFLNANLTSAVCLVERAAIELSEAASRLATTGQAAESNLAADLANTLHLAARETRELRQQLFPPLDPQPAA